MKSSVGESTEPQEHVESYLKRTMPHCEFSYESLLRGYPPMILMWMTHNMAAFAFGDRDNGSSYTRLYDTFREYYDSHRRRLDAYELSFVYCVSADFPKLDQFRSRVETDVYFCRKFVVPIVDPLERAFERLPFLPLASAGEGRPRPPSAQTYLRQCGVPADLARYLAVPHQRGAANIVRECVEEESGWTRRLFPESATSPLEQVGGETAAVGLESLTIENFRAYRNRQVFDLSAPVTVLYGPNGFGKTSFFDAIDFAATGGVGRLRISATSHRFERAVTHLDSSAEDAAVSLTFRANGETRMVTRRVANRMQAELDEDRADRKKTLAAVTGGGVGFADRIENVVSLFRATHLFSQEHPELARGFEKDCALPPQVVSHILAFEDYASARSKGSEVVSELRGRIEERRTNVTWLIREIEDARSSIAEVLETAEASRDSSMPVRELETLRDRVEAAGLSIAEEESDRVFVRGCRAAIQVRLSQCEARIARLRKVVQKAARLPTVLDEITSLSTRREELRADLVGKKRRLEEAKVAQAENELKASALYDKLVSVVSLIDAIAWVRGNKTRYEELSEAERTTTKRAGEGSRRVEDLLERRGIAQSELVRGEQALAAAATRIAGIEALSSSLDELARTSDEWRVDRGQIRALEADIAKAQSEIEALNADAQALSSRLVRNDAKQLKVQRQIAALEEQASELSRLSAEVERYVHDGCCPLCGHDHGTVDGLLTRIREARAEDVAPVQRDALAELRVERDEVTRRLEQIRQAVEEHGYSLQQLEEERGHRVARIARFEEAADRLGITAELGQETSIGESIAAQRTQVAEATAEEEERRLVLQEELERMGANVADIDRAIGEVEAMVEGARNRLESIRSEVGALRDDHRATRVSLDTDPATLVALDTRHQGELEGIESAFAEAKEAVKERRDAANHHRHKVSSLTAAVDDIGREIDALQEAVTDTKEGLMESGLEVDVDESEILRLLEEQTRESSQWMELQEFAVSVEIAMDTATTAAALQQQRQIIERKQRQIKEKRADIAVHKSWEVYFEELTKRVSVRQNEAVRNFAREYGPMASAIQQRLRPVYGFQGIETGSHEDTIRVRVTRGDETLVPYDYFSHSQQQTLLLGLFLTACMSQTWSSLSTVLLDDPINHFDDLNTYAFLDMIVGFLGGKSGPSQFVISTCDEDVFQLARSRLRHLGGDARFYQFAAIGADGPVVEEIASA